MSDGLVVDGLTVLRDGLPVCRDVSLRVVPGQITVLVGPNGAGKSTLLGGITGVHRVARGTIHLDGKDLTTMAIHRRVRAGLRSAGSGRDVFAELTVRENMKIVDSSPSKIATAFELFPRLAQRADLKAEVLSGGERQMLVIARALMRPGTVLLVDEWSLGLAPAIAGEVAATLSRLASTGLGILVVGPFPSPDGRAVTSIYEMHRGHVVRIP